MKSSVGKGIVVLTLSGVVCKILGAFFRLPLTYILGVEGIGVFQLVMSIFTFALVLTSGGISVTMSKIVSSYRAQRQYGKIKWNIYLAMMYVVFSSFVLGLLFFVLAKDISSLQQSGATFASYKLFLPILLFSSMVALFRGVYQGYEDMVPTALSQVIEQGVKFVFGLLFAFLLSKRSVELGVMGAFVGILTSEILAVVYLLLSRGKLKLRKYKYMRNGRREFYAYLVPATLGLAISAFVHFFDGLFVIRRLVSAGINAESSRLLFGLQTGVVGSILNFPIIISIALATTILPKLSFEKSSKKDESKTKIEKAFKVLWLSILPITFGIVAISMPLFQLVYPFFDSMTLAYAVKLTAIGSVATISFAVMQFLVSILQARGEFNFVVFALLFGGIGKVLCTIFLCGDIKFNIYGLPIGNLVFSIITLVLCLIKLRKMIFVDLNSFFLPLLSSLSMLVLVGYFVSIANLPAISKLVIGVLFGIAIYTIVTYPILKSLQIWRFGNKKLRRKSE